MSSITATAALVAHNTVRVSCAGLTSGRQYFIWWEGPSTVAVASFTATGTTYQFTDVFATGKWKWLLEEGGTGFAAYTNEVDVGIQALTVTASASTTTVTVSVSNAVAGRDYAAMRGDTLVGFAAPTGPTFTVTDSNCPVGTHTYKVRDMETNRDYTAAPLAVTSPPTGGAIVPTPSISASWHADSWAVRLAVGGLATGKTYTITRTSTAPASVAVPIKVWTAGLTADPEDAALSRTIEDPFVPFGGEYTYRITVTGGGSSVSNKVAVAAIAPPPDPVWDFGEHLPIFRGWKRPDIVLRAPVTDYDGEWDMRAEKVDTINSPDTAVVSDVASLKSGRIAFLTTSAEQRAQALSLFKTGRVINLRSPCLAGLADMFFRVLALSERVERKEYPSVVTWTLEFQQTRQPASYTSAPAIDGFRTWGELLDADVTWGEIEPLFGSWGAVLEADTGNVTVPTYPSAVE